MGVTQEQIGAFVLAKSEALRTLLAQRCTAEVAWHCFEILHGSPREAARKFGLWSPYRDSMFLLGLAATTPEPSTRDAATKHEWSRIHKLVADITRAYVPLFLATPPADRPIGREQREKHAIAAFAFLHYFNSGILATSEQIISRARSSLGPFDAELIDLVGLSATDALRIAEWMVDRAQRQFDDKISAWATAAHLQRQSIEERWSAARTREETSSVAERDPGFRDRLLLDPLLIQRREIEAIVGVDKATAFWNLLVTPRGSGGKFRFYTEANPIRRAPLLGVNESEAMLPVANALFDGLVTRLSDVLEESDRRASFLRCRDKALEQRTEAALGQCLGPDVEIFASVSEWRTGEYEHDLVVVWGDVLLVVEAKAAPPVEPFRDVEKAYERVRRAFRSDTGIQKAYSQAARPLRALREGRVVSLYHSNGTLARQLDPKTIARSFAMCVTADDFGAVAVDLSLLLEKGPSDPYPWAVSVNDLEMFLEGLALKHWGAAEFFAYLEQRQVLHGHVTATDELEIAGMFLRHGRLEAPPHGGRLIVAPEYADVFDDIYRASHGGSPADLSTNPNLMLRAEPDARSAIKRAYGFDPSELLSTSTPRIGRNDPCPCGSRKKYKKCHGS